MNQSFATPLTPIIQFFNEYVMDNCIKSFFQVNKNPYNIYIIIWVWIFSIIDMSALFVQQFNRNQIIDYRSKFFLGTCLAFCVLVFLLFYWCLIRGRVVHRRIDLLLKIDTTWAILRTVGKTPWWNIHLLIQKVEPRYIAFLICFIIFCDKLFGPVLLLVFKSWIIFITSSGEVGDVRKVFGLGFLRCLVWVVSVVMFLKT